MTRMMYISLIIFSKIFGCLYFGGGHSIDSKLTVTRVLAMEAVVDFGKANPWNRQNRRLEVRTFFCSTFQQDCNEI